jgi:two-component system, sensor histidine kinase YesM
MNSNGFFAFFHLRKSIQAKIFTTFGTVTLLAIVLVTCSAYFNSSATIRKHAASFIADSIRHADETITIMLADLDQISIAVVTNKDVANSIVNDHYPVSYEWFQDKKMVEDFLSSLTAYKSYISRIAVISLDGRTFQSGGTLVIGSIVNEPWYKKVLEENKRSVLFNVTSQNTVMIARPIYAGGKPAGVMFVDFNADMIPKMYDIQPLSGSLVIVVAPGGEVVFQSRPTHIPHASLTSILEATSSESKERLIKVDGTNYLTVNFKSGFTGWTTVGMIPENILMQDVKVIRGQLISISVIVLLSMLVVSIMVSNQITRNIRRLRNSMQLVKKGHLSVKPQIVSQDEVGELSEVFVSMMGNIVELLEDIKRREQQKREAELKVLQAQISPHFLYNTLNTIKYLSQLQRVHNIEEVTGALIELLRATVNHTTELVPIREEVEYIRRYAAIQKYKYSDKYLVICQMEDEILDYYCPKLILQPIVENALLHGSTSGIEEGRINLQIISEDNTVKFLISDNGKGMTHEQIEHVLHRNKQSEHVGPGGIGIINVDERIKLIFGNSYGLTISSLPGIQTIVEINIPVIKGGDQS